MAYVDLSAEVRPLPGAGSQGELLSVYSLVNSVVANFPVVKRVQLLVDDKPVETLGGHVDLSRPLLPDMTFLVQPSPSPSPAGGAARASALEPGPLNAAFWPFSERHGGVAASPVDPGSAGTARRPPEAEGALGNASGRGRTDRPGRPWPSFPAQPAAALAAARKALELTADFEPTAFVRAGRKGEVVEDAYLAARDDLPRSSRAPVRGGGPGPRRGGDAAAALRYLRRAVDLDPGPERTTGLVRTLLAQGRGREALAILERAFSTAAPPPENVALLQQAVDLVGLPSAQVELDRVRLRALAGAQHIGTARSRSPPTCACPRTRSSAWTMRPVNVLYAAEASCRTCSADLAELKRLVLPPARVLLVPESLEQDRALRQVVDLYRFGFSLLLGKGLLETLALPPRNVLVVARGGWSGAALTGPWSETAARRPRDPGPPGRRGDAAARRVEPREAGPGDGGGASRPPARGPRPGRGSAAAARLRGRPRGLSAAASSPRRCAASKPWRRAATASCSRPRLASTAPSASWVSAGAKRRASSC